MASYIYRELDRSGVNAANCTCTYCELRAGVNLPAPRNIDIDQLQTFAADFAQSIFDDWTALNAILKRHEVTIRKRWQRKGTAWRSNVLLTAQPHMPLYHRADFEGCGKSNDRGQGGVQRKRTFGAEAHLIPYINKKDLLHDHHLLLFLNSRGRNLPELFLKTEVEKAHLDVEWKAYYMPTTDADKYVMFFNFGLSEMPRRYGYVTKRESLPPSIVRRAGVKPIYGLLLMEIQQKIYGFLLRCVQAILHDYDKIMLMQVPEQVEPVPLECNVVSKIGHHAVEADYRRPLEAANLGRLQFLVSSRREVAEDHIVLLREDPGYFLDNLRAWREYYKDPGVKDSLPIWQRLASYMLGDALISLFTWTSLAIQLADMRPLDDQIASSNPRTYQLDAEDEKKWAALMSNIHWMQMNPMSELRETIPRSSGLRAGLQEPHDHETCHANPKCPGPHGCESEWNLKQGASPAHHRVVLNFSMLAGVDPARLALHGLRAVVQETHHMLEHDHAARALIDPWLLTEFCDLAVFSDLEYCINMMQPYSCYLPTRNEPTDETVDNLKMIAELSVAASDGGHGVHGLGDPLDGRFHYPADKHRTAETVKQMRRAESALQDYWEKVAVSMKRYGIDLELMLKDQMMTYTPLSCKTKAWDDQLTTLKKPAKVMERVKQQSNAVFTTPVGKENLKTVINLEEKLKPKTRGSPPDTVTVNPAPAANDPFEPRQPIAVPRRVFKVMSALLPSPATISEASREIAWKDFQFAFNAIGLVPEKLYGSDWLFKPLPKGEGLVSVNRSIHFHEPHSTRQGSKIDAQKVRHYGARLKRVFGWDGETFVCA